MIKDFDSTQAWVSTLMGSLLNLIELDFPLLSYLFPYYLFTEDLMVKNMCLGAELTEHQSRYHLSASVSLSAKRG